MPDTKGEVHLRRDTTFTYCGRRYISRFNNMQKFAVTDDPKACTCGACSRVYGIDQSSWVSHDRVSH